MKPLGLGIIGYGGFGEFTAQAYATMPQVRIAAITDVAAARREEAAARFHATAHADIDQLLADPEVDLVTIATPPWLHVPQALKAIQAGKHVFLEKPLATTLKDADTLVAAAREHGVQIQVDYVLRYVPLYATLQKLVHSKLLGKVTYIRLENTASNEALHSQHWFWDRSRSGGIFIEHGVHFFDLCNQLVASKPVLVSGNAHTGSDGRQDRVMSSVSYSSGALAHFYHAFDRLAILEKTVLRVVMERGTATAYGWIPDRLEIEGTLATSDYPALEQILQTELTIQTIPAPEGITGATAGQLVQATLTRPDRTGDYANAIRAGMADLVRSIQEPDYTPGVTLQDAYESFRLAFLSQQSIEQGRSQSYEQQ